MKFLTRLGAVTPEPTLVELDAALVERGILLPASDAAAWDERACPHGERGVRIDWAITFVRALQEMVNRPREEVFDEQQRRYESALSQQQASLYRDGVPWVDALPPRELHLVQLTTRELVADCIVPLTEAHRTPLLARVPPERRGEPSVFLSHSWDAVTLALPRAGRHGTLDAFGPGIAGVKEPHAWLDIVCYNQHELSHGAIAHDMEGLVRGIGRVAFAVTTVPLFNRIWCLHELVCAARNDCATQFCAAPGYRTDKRIMANDFFSAFASVAFAHATFREDYEAILAEFVTAFGSVGAADRYVRDLMRTGMGHEWFELHDDRP